MIDAETTALIAIFADPHEADRFMDELRQAAFPENELGILKPGSAVEAPHVEESAAWGAAGGVAVGACAGAVAAGLIPGVGPVLAGGLLAGLLGGAAVGAAAGGLLGALIDLGIPEDEAHRYAREFQAGRTLVVVQSPSRYGEALAILHHCREEAELVHHT